MRKKLADQNKNKENPGKSLILRGISFVFLLIAIFSGFLFYREYLVYQQGVDAYASIADMVIMDADVSGTKLEGTQAVVETQAAEPGAQTKVASNPMDSQQTPVVSTNQLDYQRVRKLLNVNFDRLTGINPDAVGWILSENTSINYPLVQGRDNSYYLSRLVNNEVNRLGSIFMDYRNKRDFSDEHTLIYGHNMKDGSMFSELELYKEPGYYADHKAIYLLTKDQIFRVDVIAGYVTTPQKIGQIYSSFDTLDAREKYISEARRLSNFQSEVGLSQEDRIVSFFTCDYTTEDSRFVVIGKLVPLNP